MAVIPERWDSSQQSQRCSWRVIQWVIR